MLIAWGSTSTTSFGASSSCHCARQSRAVRHRHRFRAPEPQQNRRRPGPDTPAQPKQPAAPWALRRPCRTGSRATSTLRSRPPPHPRTAGPDHGCIRPTRRTPLLRYVPHTTSGQPGRYVPPSPRPAHRTGQRRTNQAHPPAISFLSAGTRPPDHAPLRSPHGNHGLPNTLSARNGGASVRPLIRRCRAGNSCPWRRLHLCTPHPGHKG